MAEDTSTARPEEASCLYCESPDYVLSQVLRAEVFCPECGTQLSAAVEGSYHLTTS